MMTCSRPKYRRRSIRLADYDYSQGGAYFVTICTHDRKCLFGNISNGEMRLNEVGEIVQDVWLRTEQIRREISLDTFVLMPNHVHGVVFICDDAESPTRATRQSPLVRLRACSHREVEVLSRSALQPVTDCNCVAVRRGGEQQEVN
ncbi:MAG: transposase, partial [Desulfomonilaceae bacterium]